MDARLQLRVQRYGWDKAVDFYERGWRSQLAPAQERLLRDAALQPGESVLDVACGTGLVTFPAALQVGPTGRVLATDLSDRMIDNVRAAAAARGLDNITAARMDAEQLDAPDDSFDAALCALGLMYVTDPVKSLQEMKRVIRTGGRAVIAVWGQRSNCGWAGIFPTVDARVNTEVCPLFFQLGTGDALRMSMEAAGFTAVQVERISTVLCYTTDDDALMAAFAAGPVALAYSRFDDNLRNEAHEEYLATIARYRVQQGYEIPGEFVVARGSKAA
jgi:ubiquinone/menaquinone biosynthesis C-methylase UbiE